MTSSVGAKSAGSRPLVAIVIPAYNEEKRLGSVIDGVRRVLARTGYKHEIIVVNDCSTDKTEKVARQKKVRLINHKVNKGYGGALITGFRAAKEKGDIIITFDGDGQHNPSELISLIRPIEKKEADVVIGSRFLRKKTSFPLYRKVGIMFFTLMTKTLLGVRVSDCQSGLRAYSGEVVRTIALKNTDMGISLEILARVADKNFRMREVPSVVDYSKVHYSKNPIAHGILLFKSLIEYYLER